MQYHAFGFFIVLLAAFVFFNNLLEVFTGKKPARLSDDFFAYVGIVFIVGIFVYWGIRIILKATPTYV